MKNKLYKDVLFRNEKFNDQYKFWIKKVPEFIESVKLPFKNSPSNLNLEKQFEFGKELSQKIIHISNNSDLGIYIQLTAFFYLYLYRITGKGDIIISSPLIKTKDSEKNNYILNQNIFFYNEIDPNESIKQLLLKVKKSVIESFKNQNFPLDIIYDEKRLSKEDIDKINSIILSYDGLHDKPNSDSFDLLNIHFQNKSGNILMNIAYKEATLNTERVNDFFKVFSVLLYNCLIDLEKSVKHVSLLSYEDKKEILYGFNNTTKEIKYHEHIDVLFENQVLKSSCQIAVVCKNEQITYGKLNEEADKLSNSLLEIGVGLNEIIPIIMDNSIEMVIGILGILKTGAAFLPIDPDCPGKRIVKILNNCKAKVLITRKAILNTIDYYILFNENSDKIKIHQTAPRGFIKDINSLPFPDRSLIDYEKYSNSIGQSTVKNSISLNFSRGCIYNCAFCFKIWSNKNYQHRSAENMFEEIHMLYKKGIRRFSFVDDLPNFNVKESSKLYELIIKNKLKIHIFYPNGLRGDILSKQYIDLMVEAGTVNMDLALETSSPRLQKLINKNLVLDRLYENLDYIINTYPDFIIETQILHGLPSETEEEAIHSLETIMGFKWLHFPYVHLLKIFPGSDMEKIALENGISKEAIKSSDELGYYQIPETIQFSKNFTKKLLSRFVNEYLLSKERLIYVIPRQMKFITEDEFIQRHNSYLPLRVKNFDEFLKVTNINRNEIRGEFLPDDFSKINDLNLKLKSIFVKPHIFKPKTKILLLDLSSFFTNYTKRNVLYDVLEPPLGLMYLMTYIEKESEGHIVGRVLKSRVDFDSFEELKEILLDYKPDVIGIRTMNFFKDFLHKTVAYIRSWKIDRPIICGGPYATSCYKTMLLDNNIDLAVLGEGEITFYELLQKIISNNNQVPDDNTLKTVKGIAFIEKEYKEQLILNNRKVVCIDEPSIFKTNKFKVKTKLSRKVNDPIYVLFTSGSSGEPKGTIVEHTSVINLIDWYSNKYNVSSQTQILQLTNYTFDPFIEDIFGSLLNGATLHLSDKDLISDKIKFLNYIESREINIINFIPTILEQLIDTEKKIKSLKNIIVGGEKLEESFKTKLVDKGYLLTNNYGLTETTVDSLMDDCSQEQVKIGKPINNVKCYILDNHLNPLPVGFPGNLYVGGSGNYRGYLNDPELTNEKIINNPFEEYSTIFKTGDIAKWERNGKVDFLSRDDSQVKIRGHRVELTEIQHCIQQNFNVEKAIVITLDYPQNQVICAYVIFKKDEIDYSNDIENLKLHLSNNLPGFMIPAKIIAVTSFPLTRNGKVDIKSLKSNKLFNNTVHPKNEVEKNLRKLWADALEIEEEKINVEDDFFALGGHSLVAAVLINKINKEFRVDLKVGDLFKLSQIRALALKLSSADNNALKTIKNAEKREFYPLTFAQEEIFAVYCLKQDSTAYNMPVVVEVDSTKYFDLSNVIHKLIQKHECLKTYFKSINGKPVQLVANNVEVNIEQFDLKSDSLSDFVKNFVKPFRLDKPPLFRVAQVIDKNRHFLIMDIHHILVDGISLGILKNDFKFIIANNEIDYNKLNYIDYAIYQKSKYMGEKVQSQKIYWHHKYLNSNEFLSHSLFDKSRLLRYSGKKYSFQIEKKVLRDIDLLQKDLKTTLYIILFGVFNIAISNLTKCRNVIIGSPVNIRNNSFLDKLVGVFLNVLAIKTSIDFELSIRDFLLRVKNDFIQAIDNKEYSYYEFIKYLRKKNIIKNQLVDIVFTLHNNSISEYDKTLNSYDQENGLEEMTEQIKFPLTFDIVAYKDVLLCWFNYSDELFHENTIIELSNAFIAALEQVTNIPEIKIKDIDLSEKSIADENTFNFKLE